MRAFTAVVILWAVVHPKAARADCVGPLDFDPWCAPEADTALLVQVREFREEERLWAVEVDAVFGAPQGVAVGVAVDLTCSSDCRAFTPLPGGRALLLLATTSTFSAALPVNERGEVEVTNLTEGYLTTGDPEDVASAGLAPDAAVCEEAMFAAAGLDPAVGLSPCDDTPPIAACASSGGAGTTLSLLGVILCGKRRRGSPTRR